MASKQNLVTPASQRKRDVATSSGALILCQQVRLGEKSKGTGSGSHVALTPRRSPVA